MSRCLPLPLMSLLILLSAIATLDLSEINALVRSERGTDLAWMLLDIMERTCPVVRDKVPAGKAGESWVFSRFRNGAVRIGRSMRRGTTVLRRRAILWRTAPVWIRGRHP